MPKEMVCLTLYDLFFFLSFVFFFLKYNFEFKVKYFNPEYQNF